MPCILFVCVCVIVCMCVCVCGGGGGGGGGGKETCHTLKLTFKMHFQYSLQEAHGPHRSPELTAVNMYM